MVVLCWAVITRMSLAFCVITMCLGEKNGNNTKLLHIMVGNNTHSLSFCVITMVSGLER